MRTCALFLILAAAVTPALAQNRLIDLSGFATWVDPSGENDIRFDPGSADVATDFDGDQGWGLALNIFWSNRISTEFAAATVEPDLNIRSAVPLSEGLQMVPLTAVLQLHLLPRSGFDPYIGIGAAYVLFDDIEESRELDEVDVEAIDFDDDYGVVWNAGVSWALSAGLALYLDVKYVPIESAARAVFTQGPGQATEIEINPLMLSAGLSFRF